MKQKLVITIDGTSGSGKTALASELAKHIGYRVIYSGLIYRKIAQAVMQNGINFSDEYMIAQLAKKINFNQLDKNELMHDDIADAASKIAILESIRDIANNTQRFFAQHHKKVIIEGRDAGTIVLPEADVKFYIDANPEIRAKRRFKQLQDIDNNAIQSNILDGLLLRDQRDKMRKIAPLIVPKGAYCIDNSCATLEESLHKMLQIVKKLDY